MNARPSLYVHLLPSLIQPGALKGGVAVVVDVLRASTVIVHALAAGCAAVIPCLEVDEARKTAASLPPGTALLGGERDGEQIEGFHLGNSPASYTNEACLFKTLVITTTNGTRAILASLDADSVLVAAFVNRKATLDALSVNVLKARGRDMHIVCSGTQGFISLEDTLFAGSLATSLHNEWAVPLANDSAQIAAGLWKGTVRDRLDGQSAGVHPSPGGEVQTSGQAALERLNVEMTITFGRGGGNVRRLGLDQDIKDAAHVDRFDLVAQLLREPLRIVASHVLPD
jgi:2-phosphosulfolactate phosphatase